jgi:8-amino-7-oxononanoate synthase
MRLVSETHDTIAHVPIDRWNSSIHNRNPLLHSDHLKAIEQSKINGIRPFYTLVTDGISDGIAYFFSMKMDFGKLGHKTGTGVNETMKQWFPDFMVMDVLECGLLSGLGETISVEESRVKEYLPAIVRQMEASAEEMGSDVILIRDIPLERLDSYKEGLTEKGFVPVLGFPTARLDLRWNSIGGYLDSLRAHISNTMRKQLLKLDVPEFSVEVIHDYRPYSLRLEELWTGVYERSSEYDHEKLTAAYFSEINRCLNGKSFIIAIKRKDEIVSFSLGLDGSDTLYFLYTGFDERWNREYNLYFNSYYFEIQEAIKMGKKTIDYGVTAYDFKTKIGCELKPLIYFVKHVRHPEYTLAFAKMIKESIGQPENLHHPFKYQDTDARIQLEDVQRKLDESSEKNPHDIFNKAHTYSRARTLQMANMYGFFPAFEGVLEPKIQYHGQSLIMLGSNSYMGLASHPEIIKTAQEIMKIYGTGCSGSPFLNGTLDIHLKLADSLSAFMQKESALLFSTGYQTNLGIIGALAGRHSVLIMDSLNHASLVDAARSALGEVDRYRHNDMEDLERLLKKHERKEKLVISDSVFSMEGTMARIPEIVRLCRQYGARLMLDEAHGIGVLGPEGRGAAEHFGVLDQVDIIMGTFSKSFAAVGGFVAGEAEVIEYLRHNSRSHMFSASLPPVIVAIVQKALEIIIREPERRCRLLKNAEYLSSRLVGLGYKAPYQGTAIIPIHVGDEILTLGLFNKLFKDGVYVNPVLSPAVPKGQECLRTSTMATHNTDEIDQAVEIFKKVRTPQFPCPIHPN